MRDFWREYSLAQRPGMYAVTLVPGNLPLSATGVIVAVVVVLTFCSHLKGRDRSVTVFRLTLQESSSLLGKKKLSALNYPRITRFCKDVTLLTCHG